MGGEYKDDPSFKAWGPFISPNYKNEPITQTDIIIASTVWGLTLLNCILATHLAIKQTKESRSPLRSVYIWMIWLEMAVCFVMGLECFLHLLKYISPSTRPSEKLHDQLLTTHQASPSILQFSSGGVFRFSYCCKSSSTVFA